QNRTLNGSAIITFSEFRAMVNRVQYEAVEKLGTAKLKLEIPQISTMKKNRTTQELGIHKLKMEDLETKLRINRIRTGVTIHMTTTYTMLSVILIIVLAVACFSKRTTIFTPAAPPASFASSIAPPVTFTPTIAPL
ncbi:hypothetical protein KR054_002022, partial [Drosophila jambulina]